MAFPESSNISAGDTGRIEQYNNLRADVLDNRSELEAHEAETTETNDVHSSKAYVDKTVKRFGGWTNVSNASSGNLLEDSGTATEDMILCASAEGGSSSGDSAYYNITVASRLIASDWDSGANKKLAGTAPVAKGESWSISARGLGGGTARIFKMELKSE